MLVTSINLPARRFFLDSQPAQCGRKGKLIQGFEYNVGFRNPQTTSQMARTICWRVRKSLLGIGLDFKRQDAGQSGSATGLFAAA